LIGERSRRTALLQRETNRVPAAFLHGEHASVVVEVGRDEAGQAALIQMFVSCSSLAYWTVTAFGNVFDGE